MSDDEWTVQVVNLDAYLERINYRGPVTCNSETMAALHRAHVAAIPFENLDVIVGRGVSVELEAIQAKLVERRRGGYCYEHGLLFGAVLQRPGFAVDRRLARIGDHLPRLRPRTHMGVSDHRRWLAALLAESLTVYNYDRRGRGRGDSGDTLPYSVDREIEDLTAVIAHTGGTRP